MTALYIRDQLALAALGPHAIATPNFWDDMAVFDAYVAHLAPTGGTFTTSILDAPIHIGIIENVPPEPHRIAER